MRLKINHTTHYTYDPVPNYLVQRLMLEPVDFAGQRTVSWSVSAPGIENALRYVDGFGNRTILVTVQKPMREMSVTASGEIETRDAAGVVAGLQPNVPEAVYLRKTQSTIASPEMEPLLAQFADEGKPLLERAHALMAEVHARVPFAVGTSHSHTTAAQAFAEGSGVCQDHAQIMVAIARACNVPARYVTGYLVTGIGASSAAAHAWAELLIPHLGWVGFDATNLQCPTDHYVRIAAGLDAAAVVPVRGTRRGLSGDEKMTVEVRVEIAQQ